MKEKIQKETVPKTPEEEVKDFISEMNLDTLLPKTFETLDKAQKLKVIRDLKQRIVDIVKSDAQTQYSEDVKERGGIAKIRASINKESEIKNFEIKAFATIKNTEEGKKLIADNLTQLTEMTKDREVSINKNKPEIIFINPNEASDEIEKTAITSFNIATNNFREIPYEWGQEKVKLEVGNVKLVTIQKKRYEKAKAEYEKARNEILEIAKKRYPEAEIKDLMINFLQLDNLIKMDQLINTHPEFEAELNRLSKSGKSENLLAQGKDVWNMAGGKGTINKAIFAGGYGARWLAKGAALASGITIMTGVAAVTVGGIIGGIRGRIRGKQTLEERQKEARHGKKDTSKEKNVTTDATHLNERLEKLIQEIENTVDEKEQAKKLSMLSVRIEHTMGKIEKGQVNLGDSKSSLINEYNLVNNLNKALVLRETMSEKTNIELQVKINLMLARTSSDIAEKTSEAQKKFINKQMLKGVAMGAGFATAGYALRYVGEHLGWWGGHGTETVAPKNITPAPAEPATALETSSSIKNFTNEGIKFENGKGGIEGVLDLKKQIAEQYHGDYSKAPESVRNFMNTDVTKEAIKLGFFDPNNPNGKESARIIAGSVLKFDEHGNLLFGKPDVSGNIPVLEKYHGEMFDSDHNADHNANVTQETTAPKHTPPPETVETAPKTEIAPEPTTAEDLKTKIEEKIDAGKEKTDLVDPLIKKPSLGYKTVGIGTPVSIGTPVETGSISGTGEVFAGDYQGNQSVIVVEGHEYFRDPSSGQYHDAFNSKQYFPEITPDENAILQHHPEFAENPFNLSGKELMQSYNARLEDINHLFKNNELQTSRFIRLKVNDLQLHANNPIIKRLSDYVILLKNSSGLEPKTGLLERSETTQDYIAKAYQALAAGKGKMSLEKFQEILRK